MSVHDDLPAATAPRELLFGLTQDPLTRDDDTTCVRITIVERTNERPASGWLFELTAHCSSMVFRE